MAWNHGRNTLITLSGSAITGCNTSELSEEADEEDMTCYGDNDGVVAGSTKRGTVTMGGKYVVGATGPAAVIRPLLQTNVAMTVKPEGTGTGKPLLTFDVHVKKYVQTMPAAGYVTWSAELTKTGAIATTTQ
ncbi:MAG TPA: hypothetical protein VGP91_18050 [Actinoplanes sp.]|jgi:hypothetical protein|nr:hypothetical protein [Actinoplanes sp.]